VYYLEGRGWIIKDVSYNGKNSNHPQIKLLDNVPKILTDHDNNYSINVVVQKIGNQTHKKNYITSMGLEGILTSENNRRLKVSGYTKLGNEDYVPAIKQKKLTFTTPSEQGKEAVVGHYLSKDKILSISVIVENDNGDIVSEGHTYYGGNEFSVMTLGAVHVLLSKTNSSRILNKKGRILITYEE
jgi:hypothetical protein